MIKRLMAVFILMASLTGLLPVLAQDEPNARATANAVTYLLTMQNDDGGFSSGYAPESDLTTTADALVAIVAAAVAENGAAELTLPKSAVSALRYLETRVESGDVTAAGAIAKVITALVATGENPGDFGGHNLVNDLLALQNEQAAFGYGAFDHCVVLIALQNAGADLPADAIEALIAAQNDDGGWGFAAGESSDTNTTGLCLQPLAETDSAEAVEAGLAYLAATQNDDGGWPYQNPSDYGTDSDTNSTALVLQALLASEQDPAVWHHPAQWLLSLQNESGSFSLQAAMPGDNMLATVAAIPALAGLPLNAWAPPVATEEPTG